MGDFQKPNPKRKGQSMSESNPAAAETPCHHVVYHGHVQGVGFRLTACQIARRFPISGYVKNMPGGTVEMVVRSEPSAQDEFLKEVDAAFAGHIDRREIREATPNECFEIETHTGFEIRY